MAFLCLGLDGHPKFKNQWAAFSKSGYETPTLFYKYSPPPQKKKKNTTAQMYENQPGKKGWQGWNSHQLSVRRDIVLTNLMS